MNVKRAIPLFIIILGFLLPFVSCRQSGNKEKNHSYTKKDTITEKTDSISPGNLKIDDLNYIIFGIFCGNCGGECATMYKLDQVKNELLVDHTDSYWKMSPMKPMVFETKISDNIKINTAKKIVDSIPSFLLTSSELKKQFGCPDCTDGCGIYLEINNNKFIKQYRIDSQTDQLSDSIKPFAEYLKKTIRQLRGRE